MTVHISPRHKAVVAPVTDALRNLFPDAPVMMHNGVDHIIIPHLPRETFLMQKHGLDVPAPILSHYDWPGNHPPFEVQKKTCALITQNPRAYVLNGMGTGKTRAALWAWDYLRSNGLLNKLLVVAPLSTLTFVWAREVFSTLPHCSVEVLHGPKKKRLERLADPDVDVFVINHDGIKTIAKELEARKDIDALVIDELAVYRNNKAARTKYMRNFVKPMKWVVGMTGSPMPNAPTDVWAQASIVTPDTVPKYYKRFEDELMYKVSTFKMLPKHDAVEKAFAVMQPSVRFTLDDVLELPDVVTRYVDVDMGSKQANIYKELSLHCHALVDGKEITAANAGAALSKLLQISLGWVYSKDRGIVPLDNNERVTALIDNINASDNKVLAFAPFKHALAGISEALDKEKIPHEVVSGDTPATRRSEVFNLFQNTDKYKVLVAHPQCLAHGITLTVADTVIWVSPITSLEIYEQANHRIRRVGQKNKQLLLHLQATPVERKIYTMLREKRNVQGRFLELMEAATKDE